MIPGFKEIFIEKFQSEIESGEIKSILDLGSGLSRSFIPFLEKYPGLAYVGVEPSREHASAASASLSGFKQAKIINADAYSPVEERWGHFDLVISLSVLEHVKQLERFLKNSLAAARPGGRVVHRWDLGHALHPSSSKESFQVWLGDHWPALLPEHKFVRTLLPGTVSALMEQCGAQTEKITYHQMPDHKKLLKLITGDSDPNAEKLIREMIEWEFEISSHLSVAPEIEKLKLFPAVALWSRKFSK